MHAHYTPPLFLNPLSKPGLGNVFYVHAYFPGSLFKDLEVRFSNTWEEKMSNPLEIKTFFLCMPDFYYETEIL
jgi:hypothetical protein